MFSFSSLVEGQVFLLRLKWPPRGVLVGLACFILNLSSIRSICFSCDNNNFLTFLSRTISIPRICLAWLRSYMSNDLNNSTFKLWINWTSGPTINILSTYNRRVMNLPSRNLLTYTKWSTFVLVYQQAIMNESNFLFQCLQAYFNPYKLFFNQQIIRSFSLTSNFVGWTM